MICIVDYITQFFTKYTMAQEEFKDKNLVFSSSKITVEPYNSESLFANNESNLYEEIISIKSSSDTESDIPMIYFLEVIKKVFYKCK